MRNAAVSVCFLSLFLGFGDPGTLRPKPVKAFSPRVSSLPPPPQATFPPARESNQRWRGGHRNADVRDD